MKTKIRVIKTYETMVDFDKEKLRIIKCFDGEMRDKLLKIIELFLSENFSGADDVYWSLPYDDEAECSGQEYMGLWWWDIYHSKNLNNSKIEII